MNSVLQSRCGHRFVFAVILCSACLSFNAPAQQASVRKIIFPATIQWDKQHGVMKYRLQIAGDEEFQNIFFDRPIVGERYVVSDLSPGYYYWRVAPAASRAGSYSKPERFFLSGGIIKKVKLSVPPPALAGGARRSRRRF